MSILKQTLLLFLLPVSLFSLLLLLFLLPTTTTTTAANNNNNNDLFSLSNTLSIPSPPAPKIAYFITGTNKDGPRIFRLLQAVYHPRNYYLLHLDQYASGRQRDQLANMVVSVPVFAAARNVVVVKKSNPVNQEGSSPLALVLHGAAILLRWKKDWDWFINLAASDYPLIPQDDFLHILSFLPRNLNFIKNRENSTSKEEHEQVTDIIVDSRLYLQTSGKMFMGDRKRTPPDTFRFLTGSPHVILNHNFVEFVILGWENFPRTLLLYFSNTRSSHKAYFQTLASNLMDFSGTVINSNLRFNECGDKTCTDEHQNRAPCFNEMLDSGSAFAGDFHVKDPALDMIDSVVLKKGRGMVAPGGWCLGKSWFGMDSCSQWGDIDILRPGLTAKKFEKLLLRLIGNTTLPSRLDG